MNYECIPNIQAQHISHFIDDYPEVEEAYATREDRILMVYLVLSHTDSDRATEIQQRLLKRLEGADYLGYSEYGVNIWVGKMLDPLPSFWGLIYKKGL